MANSPIWLKEYLRMMSLMTYQTGKCQKMYMPKEERELTGIIGQEKEEKKFSTMCVDICQMEQHLRTKLTRKPTNFSRWMNCDKNNSMKILIFTKNYIYIVYRQLTKNL